MPHIVKKQLLLCAAIISVQFCFSQCPSAFIVLESQADVDNFSMSYPGCSEITNGIGISGSDIT